MLNRDGYTRKINAFVMTNDDGFSVDIAGTPAPAYRITSDSGDVLIYDRCGGVFAWVPRVKVVRFAMEERNGLPYVILHTSPEYMCSSEHVVGRVINTVVAQFWVDQVNARYPFGT